MKRSLLQILCNFAGCPEHVHVDDMAPDDELSPRPNIADTLEAYSSDCGPDVDSNMEVVPHRESKVSACTGYPPSLKMHYGGVSPLLH